ncbi:MAG: hypothetical protein KBA31_18175 [Alphaproteobacteria bacterium]|nr:hypothetical protein [Alphaproteobacteria bacterium]
MIAFLLVLVAGIAIYALNAEVGPSSRAVGIHVLIAQKKITVTAWGKCPDGITMKIVNQVDEDLPLVIPAGTLFVSPPPLLDPRVEASSSPPAYTNLVTTEPMEFTQTRQRSGAFSVPAACAHTFGRYVKFRNDYELKVVEPKTDLARVIAVLASRPYDQVPKGGASQAAIWIAADDVGYNALGALVVRYYPNGRIYPDSSNGRNDARAIQARDTLLALDLLDKAGIDLRTRKIWADREEILRLATDPSIESAPPAASEDKEDEGASADRGERGETATATGPSTPAAQPTPAPEPPKPQPSKPAPDVRTFRDCPECPEMMATSRFFEAIGRSEVTFAQWDACVAAAPFYAMRHCIDPLPKGSIVDMAALATYPAFRRDARLRRGRRSRRNEGRKIPLGSCFHRRVRVEHVQGRLLQRRNVVRGRGARTRSSTSHPIAGRHRLSGAI